MPTSNQSSYMLKGALYSLYETMRAITSRRPNKFIRFYESLTRVDGTSVNTPNALLLFGQEKSLTQIGTPQEWNGVGRKVAPNANRYFVLRPFTKKFYPKTGATFVSHSIVVVYDIGDTVEV